MYIIHVVYTVENVRKLDSFNTCLNEFLFLVKFVHPIMLLTSLSAIVL